MAYWQLVVPAERYAAERLYANDAIDLTGLEPPLPADGDLVVLVATAEPPVVFGLGRVSGGQVTYTRRLFDEPVPVDAAEPGLRRIDAEAFGALAPQVQAKQATREWLVSLDLPIEASTPAEAVRAFWTYALRLGPAELPTFVSPVGDELAMQAYVLGEPTDLDPEEDD
jgi:hypothetical protein